MSTDLLDQLAQYGADHRARQAPVERQEILARVSQLLETDQVTDEDRPSPDVAPTARSWLPIAAAAGLIALVAGLVLATVARDASEPSDVPGTDFIRTTEPSLPPTTVDPTPATTTTTTSTTMPDGEPEAAPVQVPTIDASASTMEPVAIAAATFHDGNVRNTLGAWQAGFLHVSAVGGVRMVAEISDEMLARFPIEVQEAYPEQLVGPLDEVRSRLAADGLLDEVEAVLEADFELEAALLGGPLSPVDLLAEFTVDGETWTPIAIAAPAGIAIEDVFIVDDRLVAVGTPPDTPSTVPFKTLVVASTEDLAGWSIQTVPDAVETTREVSIAANGDGWVAHIEPDLCQVEHVRKGVGCGWPGDPRWGYDIGEGPPLTWAAEWGDVPIPVEGPVAAEGVTVIALQTGFLAEAGELWHSADGVTWATAAGAPAVLSVAGAAPLDEGSSLVFGFADTCTAERYRVDERGERWERIDLEIEGAGPALVPGSEGLVPESIGARSLPSPAVLVDDGGPGLSIGVVERDGLRLTLRWCGTRGRISESYELVDVSSGALISTESSAGEIEGQPFDYLTEIGDVVSVVDPVTGDELMMVARSDMTYTDIGYGGPTEIWLLTTGDGVQWHIDEVSDFGGMHFRATARNGDIVLVGSGDEWRRYDVGTD